MSLADRLQRSLGRHIPVLRTPSVPRATAMQLRPIRNGCVEWTRSADGEALLTVPRRDDKIGRVVGGFFHMPESRGIQLDEVGAFVWSLCDGAHTVNSIIQKTSREYRMNRREAEVSVSQFLRMLSDRNLIGMFERAQNRPGRRGQES